MIKKNRALFLIIIGFAISMILSIYNIKNHDKNIFSEDGSYYHKMIKYDVYRYLSHGDEIKNQLKEGINFFETGCIVEFCIFSIACGIDHPKLSR